MINSVSIKKYLPIIIIGILFFLTRFLAFGQMYHQDEYKWAMIVNPAFHEDLKSDHPPLVGLLYKAAGAIAGYDHLRLLPIVVSLLNLILLFLIVQKFYGKREAYVASFLYVASVYALIANTQIDIDGALLPFTMLLSFYSYMAFQKGYRSRFWLSVLIGSFILGFLIKLSFVIVIAAIATDYLLKHKINLKLAKKALIYIFSGVAFLALLTYLFAFIFKINNPLQFILNVSHFGVFNFSERNYPQLLFLTAKSMILASPFIILPLFLVFSKKCRRDLGIWFIYLFYNILFYYFIFDFTNRTIERYDIFLIIPSAIIGGVFLGERMINGISKIKEAVIASAILICSFLVAVIVSSIGAVPLPLNPKSIYIDKIKHLDFNFLIPITGGSGPIGFYVSVAFVVSLFSICALLIFWYYKAANRRYSIYLLVGFVSLGFCYNFFLEKELLIGDRYGSVDRVAKEVTAHVNNDSSIKEVITYYDIAGYELNSTGKYYKRFYTDPIFSDSNVSKFADYKGYYMVVDFPEINKDSVYWKYLESCKKTFEASDKDIYGYIFDCQKGNKNLFK